MSFHAKPALMMAAMMASLAAAPAGAQSLSEMKIADTSPAMRAAFDLNLDLLRVQLDREKSFNLDTYIQAQRIMNDRSDPSLKASRIENLVNNGNEFDPRRGD
ncbi:hypothetical protein [Loktanella salsilacus]|uniref:hypothetical protein n=1 Tax=Loktanella salsilacus TaxID=195913 RepID=UPI0020B7D8E4|nr:hypothetical protein [Loktanella salsilacus]UTH44889.1 hypothetical protein KBK07_01980 [Loktanella salsilacus]